MIRGKCRNHGVGLCLEPLSTYLDILCPAFCTIKRLHQGSFHNKFLRMLHHVINCKLVYLTPELDPWYRINPEHRRHAEAVLELTYYKRDMHRCYADDEERAALTAEDARRRALGNRLLEILPGDWRSKTIVFWAREEYATVSREEAVNMVYHAFLEINSHIIPVPALNKWLSVLPSVADLARGCCIHSLTAETMLCVAGKSPLAADHDSDPEFQEDAAVGIPRDQNAHWRQVNQKRQNKSIDFISDPFTTSRLVLWLLIATKALWLHYVLFRDAKAGRPAAREPAEPDAARAEASATFNLCNPHRSKARQVLRDLSAMLFSQAPGHRSQWDILYNIHGNDWPLAFLRQARVALLLVQGNVWRRLIKEFDSWPWRLVPAVDPREPMESRRAIAQSWLDQNE